MFTDLYRRDREVNFSEGELEKKYYIVPLKLVKNDGEFVRYEIDRKLISKVEQLTLNGYKKCQSNILDWMRSKNIKFDAEKSDLE